MSNSAYMMILPVDCDKIPVHPGDVMVNNVSGDKRMVFGVGNNVFYSTYDGSSIPFPGKIGEYESRFYKHVAEVNATCSYMTVPVGHDRMPIHVGDALCLPDDRDNVKNVIGVGANVFFAVNDSGWIDVFDTSEYVHVEKTDISSEEVEMLETTEARDDDPKSVYLSDVPLFVTTEYNYRDCFGNRKPMVVAYLEPRYADILEKDTFKVDRHEVLGCSISLFVCSKWSKENREGFDNVLTDIPEDIPREQMVVGSVSFRVFSFADPATGEHLFKAGCLTDISTSYRLKPSCDYIITPE